MISVQPSHGVDVLCAPSRSVLEPLLVRRAVDAGVDVRLGTTVTDLLWRGGRVAGVRIAAPAGWSRSDRRPAGRRGRRRPLGHRRASRRRAVVGGPERQRADLRAVVGSRRRRVRVDLPAGRLRRGDPCVRRPVVRHGLRVAPADRAGRPGRAPRHRRGRVAPAGRPAGRCRHAARLADVAGPARPPPTVRRSRLGARGRGRERRRIRSAPTDPPPRSATPSCSSAPSAARTTATPRSTPRSASTAPARPAEPPAARGPRSPRRSPLGRGGGDGPPASPPLGHGGRGRRARLDRAAAAGRRAGSRRTRRSGPADEGPDLGEVAPRQRRVRLLPDAGHRTAHRRRRARPPHESTYSRRSFAISAVRKPASYVPVSTRLGNLSTVAELRPVEALSTSSITARSSPWARPKASASDVAASAVAERKLLSSFMVWPCPASVPTWKMWPAKASSTARWSSSTAAGPANMSASVPARAPATPPDTGPSTYVTPTAASTRRRLGRRRRARPSTGRPPSSPAGRRRPRWHRPRPATPSPSGRLSSTVSARAATSSTPSPPPAPAGSRSSVPAASKPTSAKPGGGDPARPSARPCCRGRRSRRRPGVTAPARA